MNYLLLTYKLVRGVWADVLMETIHHFLFGPEFMGLTTTKEFDNRLRILRSRRTMRDAGKREKRKDFDRWVVENITELGTEVP